MKDIEAKEDEINLITAESLNRSRVTTKASSRISTAKTKSGKKLKRKKSKSSSKSNSRPNTDGIGADSDMDSPSKAQEAADFAEEMRLQFRPFDDDSSYSERPLSRSNNHKPSSRDGGSREGARSRDGGGRASEALGGEFADKFNPKSNIAEPVGNGSSTPTETFQNIPLDQVGRNDDFYNLERIASAKAKLAQQQGGVAAAVIDDDDYDAYEDEFDEDM